jgi:hypothetical protein
MVLFLFSNTENRVYSLINDYQAHLLQEKSHLNEIGKKERLLLALEGLLVAEKPL